MVKVSLKDIEELKARMDSAFALMNAYAKDPYNMGAPAAIVTRIDPQSILAEVYLIMAPVSQLMTRILEEVTNDRCGICGAKKDTHQTDHLCRMHMIVHNDVEQCSICGRVK